VIVVAGEANVAAGGVIPALAVAPADTGNAGFAGALAPVAAFLAVLGLAAAFAIVLGARRATTPRVRAAADTTVRAGATTCDADEPAGGRGVRPAREVA